MVNEEKLRGREIHKYLTREAFRIYKDKGYNPQIEYRLPNKKVADIYIEKGKEKIILECLIRPNLKIIEQKIKNYKNYNTKLIICYPSFFTSKIPIDSFAETLKIDIPETINRITQHNITVDEELVGKAKKILGNYGGKLSPVINILLKDWIKKEEKKDDIN
jgi:hypothetical protein